MILQADKSEQCDSHMNKIESKQSNRKTKLYLFMLHAPFAQHAQFIAMCKSLIVTFLSPKFFLFIFIFFLCFRCFFLFCFVCPKIAGNFDNKSNVRPVMI